MAKTTLIAHVVKAMDEGGDLAGELGAGKVLIVTEESGQLWTSRHEHLRIGDHVECIVRPFKGRPKQKQWEQLIDCVAALVRQRGYVLVILDTFGFLSPVDDENDAARMLTALAPLHSVTEAGTAVLLIHHMRKGGGPHGQASRGSSALTGFVDIIISLERLTAQAQDRRRKLKALSRFNETPDEVVIELGDGGYRAIGTTADATCGERQAVIKGRLPCQCPGLTVDEIWARWPNNTVTRPGKSRLGNDLKEGFEKGLWHRTGDGVKGDPFRYHTPHPDSIRPSPPSIGGRNESNADGGSDG